MARSCGIHIGQRRWAIVVLDGSPKKHGVVLREAGDVPAGEDPIQATAGAMRDVAKRIKVPGENVGLAVDSGLAAFRTVSLPFDDPAKIEDVIKFEVESDLPQWDIDDVVVDFLTLSRTPGVESTLLVTAVPKDRLEARIRACEKAGLEPYEVELDSTALFNAAHAAGMLDPESAQVLVHVGDATTAVVVADGGHLASMRSIHTGTTPAPRAPRAEDEELELEGEESEPAPEEPDAVDLERFRVEAAARIRRELARTLSGAALEHPVEAVYVTGMELPELLQGPVLDVPVRPFPPLPSADDDVGECAVAYGAALRRLGGGLLKGTLRREELRFSGKFERLELPLAVLGMLTLTCLWVLFIVLDKQILWRGEGRLASGPDDPGSPGDMQIWLQRSNDYMLPDPDADTMGRLSTPPENIEVYARAAERGEIENATKMGQLQEIRRRLDAEIARIKRDLGQSTDAEALQPQSAFEALTTVLELIEAQGDSIGRVSFRGLTADTQGGRINTDPYVEVELDVDFHADDTLQATRHYNDLQAAFEEQPWCRAFERKPNKVFDDGKGIYVDEMTIEVDTRLIPDEEEA